MWLLQTTYLQCKIGARVFLCVSGKAIFQLSTDNEFMSAMAAQLVSAQLKPFYIALMPEVPFVLLADPYYMGTIGGYIGVIRGLFRGYIYIYAAVI